MPPPAAETACADAASIRGGRRNRAFEPPEFISAFTDFEPDLASSTDETAQMTRFLGWPGLEPGRPFGLQIFAPLWLSPPQPDGCVCGPDCALTL